MTAQTDPIGQPAAVIRASAVRARAGKQARAYRLPVYEQFIVLAYQSTDLAFLDDLPRRIKLNADQITAGRATRDYDWHNLRTIGGGDAA